MGVCPQLVCCSVVSPGGARSTFLTVKAVYLFSRWTILDVFTVAAVLEVRHRCQSFVRRKLYHFYEHACV